MGLFEESERQAQKCKSSKMQLDFKDKTCDILQSVESLGVDSQVSKTTIHELVFLSIEPYLNNSWNNIYVQFVKYDSIHKKTRNDFFV